MRKRFTRSTSLIERELPWKFTAQVGYVGTRAVGSDGVHQHQRWPAGNRELPVARSFIKFGLHSGHQQHPAIRHDDL